MLFHYQNLQSDIIVCPPQFYLFLFSLYILYIYAYLQLNFTLYFKQYLLTACFISSFLYINGYVHGSFLQMFWNVIPHDNVNYRPGSETPACVICNTRCTVHVFQTFLGRLIQIHCKVCIKHGFFTLGVWWGLKKCYSNKRRQI